MNKKTIPIIVLFSVFILAVIGYVNVSTCIGITRPSANQISSGWQETCKWLRENTEKPSSYYDLNAKPEWGVMSWWDYGYWITREGERPAMCNPGSNIRYEVATYLLSDNYSDVHDALKSKHIKYIIIDYLMTTAKFYAIDTLAHAPMGEQYLPTKYQQDYTYWDNENNIPIMLNYEEYYRSLAVRLYNFNGQPVQSPGTPVFVADTERNIKGIYDFPNKEQAQEYVDRNGGIIAGSDPLLSPYQMDDSLTGYYKLVWQSNSQAKIGNWTYPEVKIFEVLE